MNDIEITLLSDEQTFGNQKIDVIEQLGVKCAVSDFAILLGAYVSGDYRVSSDDSSLRGRTGWWYLSSSAGAGDVRAVNKYGSRDWVHTGVRSGGVRPVIPLDSIDNISIDFGSNGVLETEFGEYPQYVVDTTLGRTLESEFLASRLRKTGKTYTTDSRRWNANSERFSAKCHEEFEYGGKRYVRVKSNDTNENFKLTNGVTTHPGDYFWLEVSPITWYVDEKSKLLVSKIALASGIRFCNDGQYKGDFKTTEMYTFLNTYFAKEIIPHTTEKKTQSEEKKKKLEQINPYGFKFNKVSEEEIIKGAIESGVAVFLHGPSSEGKSARVKQIDPTCEIIYLRNASPESLNGKSVYNQETGEMIDVKPTWLKKVEAKCENEPDRLHIIFFDEITNALPSIQGIAFNIVLDREVNGIWKLPENARIVASGNEIEDSLAANQLAEPLFNRFAHVYIKTTTESWLRWASENGIHPAIYAYIAYKKGETLRSKFDGEKPNADPRKWEMASKMLYATGKPEMLRSLVGEDITKEFIAFCKTKIITLEDVIADNYSEEEIKNLNTAERYATTMCISQVDEDNLEKVRNFAYKLGGECRAVFDSLWTHGDEARLEKIAELGQEEDDYENEEIMITADAEITLLTKDEVDGNKKLDALEKYGNDIKITDLVILSGAEYNEIVESDGNINTGYYYTKTFDEDGDTFIVDEKGKLDIVRSSDDEGIIRPVLILPNTFYYVYQNKYAGDSGTYEVELGEYPQFTVSNVLQKELENAYQHGKLIETNNEYTFCNKVSHYQSIVYKEYEYKKDKYIRIKSYCYFDDFELSNGEIYQNGDYVWVRVTPIKWLVDIDNKKLISKYGLLSGVKFGRPIGRKFETTKMYNFLNKYMIKDILQSYEKEKGITKKLKKK